MVDLASRKVLVVDDDRLVCWALSRELAVKRLDRQVVATGKDCLAEIGKTDYDLVFLDIHLPDANGIDLLQEIRHRSPRTSVVMISGDGTSKNKEDAIAGGAIQFLEKPFDLSLVDRILNNVFGEYPEHRKGPRYICNLRLWVVPTGNGGREEAGQFEDLFGTAEDIGPHGIRISTISPLQLAQTVRLKVMGDGDAFRRFLPENGEAKVIWVSAGTERFTAGLRYLTPNPASSPGSAASRR